MALEINGATSESHLCTLPEAPIETVFIYYLKVDNHVHLRHFDETHAQELGFKAIGYFSQFGGLRKDHAMELIQKWNDGSNGRFKYLLYI